MRRGRSEKVVAKQTKRGTFSSYMLKDMKNQQPSLPIRAAQRSEIPALEEIRIKAFVPVFASFRNILGEEIYEIAQKHEDESQADHLVSLFDEESPWEVYVTEEDERLVGFIAIRMDRSKLIGEIGLNAVDPDHAGKGIGTGLYKFAVAHMKKAGMRVATVATGGDESHAPARKAYEKAGFNVRIPSYWYCQKL